MVIGTKIKMVYRSMGVLFSEAGYSIAFAEFHENAGAWTYELKNEASYSTGNSISLIEKFIEENNLHYKVALITVHAETVGIIFNGASIAAVTSLPVITDLSALDVELGGNGEFFKTSAEKLNLTAEMNNVNKGLCIAFMGILRWREEYNFLSSTTGAKRSSIGGAIWLGQEA